MYVISLRKSRSFNEKTRSFRGVFNSITKMVEIVRDSGREENWKDADLPTGSNVG